MPSRPILLPWIPLWTTISVASLGCWFVPQIQFAAQGSCDSLHPMRQKYVFAHLLSLGNRCVSWGVQLFKRVIHHDYMSKKHQFFVKCSIVSTSLLADAPKKKQKNNNTSGTCDHLPTRLPRRATLDQLETCLWCMTSQELLNPEAIQRAFRSKSQTLLFGSCNWGDFLTKLEDDPPIFLGRLPPFWNFWAEWAVISSPKRSGYQLKLKL